MKIIAIVLLQVIVASASGQTISAFETIKNYRVAQKRLLVINTFQFANFVSQYTLDQDSIMEIASRITGMPFLLPYNEGFSDKASGGEDLIHSGKIADAKLLLKNANGEKRMQLSIELAIWYLHQPGTHEADLDSASFYLQAASRLTTISKYSTWENECRLLTAELSYQKGNIPKTCF